MNEARPREANHSVSPCTAHMQLAGAAPFLTRIGSKMLFDQLNAGAQSKFELGVLAFFISLLCRIASSYQSLSGEGRGPCMLQQVAKSMQ
jgi:hypothetical protein